MTRGPTSQLPSPPLVRLLACPCVITALLYDALYTQAGGEGGSAADVVSAEHKHVEVLENLLGDVEDEADALAEKQEATRIGACSAWLGNALS